MRPLVAVLACLLLLAPAALAQNNTTAEDDLQTNQTDDNATGNQTGNATDDGDVELPDRSGHVPWGGLAVGAVIFLGAVLVSRQTDVDQQE